MRAAWFVWWLFCGLVAIGVASAATPAPVPEATSLVVDQADALTVTEHDALLSRVTAIARAQRAQIGILISKGTGGEALAEYSLRVAEAWKLGRAGKDDGLLIVVIPSPAGARIEVGYGLEATIPDARASRWIDELLPAVREKEIARGLNELIDKIDNVLPVGEAPAAESGGVDEVFPGHPEWNVPFVLVIFSFFAIFPMFFGRWGSIPAAFLLAAMFGAAAWTFWESRNAAMIVAAATFPLPLLWGLNQADEFRLPAWLRYAMYFGNAIAVLLFFSIVSLFAGVGLFAMKEPVWPAFVFSGLLSVGLAVFFFPMFSTPLMVFLRSAMHFVFVLVLVWSALGAFIPDPTRIAFAAATIITALIALGLYLDSREGKAEGARRWSLWLFGFAILLAAPFALLALFLAVGGEDARTQLIQAAAGTGTLGGLIAIAARIGLIAAIKVGLGGAFGGGGAGRSD